MNRTKESISEDGYIYITENNNIYISENIYIYIYLYIPREYFIDNTHRRDNHLAVDG